MTVDLPELRFVPASMAPTRLGLKEHQFKNWLKPGSRVPVYRFPPITPRGAPLERLRVDELRLIVKGALL